MCLDERKSEGSGITRRAIRRSDRHRGWLCSNFVVRERQEPTIVLITSSIWGNIKYVPAQVVDYCSTLYPHSWLRRLHTTSSGALSPIGGRDRCSASSQLH